MEINMIGKKIGDLEARTILAIQYYPVLRNIAYTRFAKVPHMVVFVTMAQIYMSPVLHTEPLPT